MVKKFDVIGICSIAIIAILFLVMIHNNSPRLSVTDVLIIYPSYTQAAYQVNGFYFYYHNVCSIKCLTVHYSLSDPNQFSSSRNAFNVFKKEGFTLLDDSTLDKNPGIVNSYKKLIVLHNEYVTQSEFNTITNFPNVLYLYPNSLFAKVIDNSNHTITLIRGHGYPSKNISNGFGWKDDSTRYEMDRDCKNIQFYKVTNGYQINCYPEEEINLIQIQEQILKP